MPGFGERLKEARLKAGLSQERLGIAAGIEESSASARMNRYEVGTRTPNFELIQKIARVLNVPTAYFFAESDEEAWLLVSFHQMKRNDRDLVLSTVRKLKT